MNILLDHCVDCQVGRELPVHRVVAAGEMGWAALANGRLIAEAAAHGFDALLTLDKNFRFQQNVEKFPFTVVVINLAVAKWSVLEKMAIHVLRALEEAGQYRCIAVYLDGRVERFAPRP